MIKFCLFLFSFFFLSLCLPVALVAQSVIDDEEFLEKMEYELDSIEPKPVTKHQDSSLEESRQRKVVFKKRLIRKRKKNSAYKPVVEATPGYIPDSGAAPRPAKGEGVYFRQDSPHGQYRFSLGVANATFKDSFFQDLYKKRYGNTRFYPKLAIDWLPYTSPYMGLGVRFSLGYYSDSGRGLDKSTTKDNIVLNDLKTRFKFFPLQLGLSAAYNPFKELRWISLQGWAGYEKLYHSDSFPDTEVDGKMFVSKNDKDLLFYGGSINFGLNFLDPQSVNSMRAIGIGYLYLGLSYEVVSSFSDKAGILSLDHTSLGLSFNFESNI